MKIKLTLLGILVSMGVVSAQTATSKPVGYHTETAKGNAFTLMGVNVGNAIAAAGEFDADAATDNDADFTALLDDGVNYTHNTCLYVCIGACPAGVQYGRLWDGSAASD